MVRSLVTKSTSLPNSSWRGGSFFVGWGPLAALRFGAALVVASYALAYGAVPGFPAPAHVRGSTLVLSIVLAASAAVQLIWRRSRPVAVACLAADALVVVALILLYRFDPRDFAWVTLLVVEVEAVIVLGLWGGIGTWAVAAVFFVATEPLPGSPIGSQTDPAGIGVEIAAGFLIVVAFGLVNKEVDRERVWLRALIETAPDAMIVIDDDDTILLANRQAHLMLDWPEDALVGRSIRDVIDPDEAPTLFADRRAGDNGIELERVSALRRDGTAIPVHVSARMANEASGIRTVIVRDVSELRSAQERHRRSESRYRHVVHAMPEIVYVLDMTTDPPRPTLVDGAVLELTGLTGDEFIADPDRWFAILHPEDAAIALESLRKQRSDRSSITRRFRIRSPDGGWRWLEDRSRIEADAEGRPARVVGLARDITDELERRRELQDAERRLRTLVETLPGAVYSQAVAGDRRPLYVSPRFEELTGYSADDLQDSPTVWLGMIDPRDLPRTDDATLRTERDRSIPFDQVYRIHTKSGQVRWIHDLCTIVDDEHGTPIAWQGVFFDVTDEHEARALVQRRTDSMVRLAEERRDLMEQIVLAEEQARRRLAQDLHDDAIQGMIGLGLRTEVIAGRIEDERSREELARLARDISDTVGRLRELTFQLSPTSLEEHGLVAGLREFVEGSLAGQGVRGRVDGELAAEPSQVVRTLAYRVGQEILMNVRKHAGAGRVDVQVADVAGGISVLIGDDGVGFDVDRALAPRPGHLGLPSIVAQVERAGGRVSVTSAPGEGSRVEYWLPSAPMEPVPPDGPTSG